MISHSNYNVNARTKIEIQIPAGIIYPKRLKFLGGLNNIDIIINLLAQTRIM
jgi:hypothetical protein